MNLQNNRPRAGKDAKSESRGNSDAITVFAMLLATLGTTYAFTEATPKNKLSSPTLSDEIMPSTHTTIKAKDIKSLTAFVKKI